MMRMNMSPPRDKEAMALAALPAVKARIRDMGLDEAEHTEQGDTAEDLAHDHGTGPAHGVVAVGQQAVGDADENEDESDGEGGVAPPVDVGGRPHAAVLQLAVGPDGAKDAEGHRHQEDQVPLDGSQQAAQDQADEGT